MTDKTTRWLLTLCALLTSMLAACGESREGGQTQSVPPSGVSGAATAVKEDVQLLITPERPTSADCLTVVTLGVAGNGGYRWHVNDRQINGENASRLCGDFYRRGDRVTVAIGAGDSSVRATVTIANAPPRITGISATPDQVFADSDIQVVPVAEDRDGDPVEFRYQWLVNGQAQPFLTESRLSADHINKGDTIQVRITPFDGIDEGPVYESYAMTIPNAPPRIESTPPQQFEALAYSYQVKAVDVDGDPLSWRLDKAPQGMTIDPVSGLVSWSPQGVAPGAYPVRIVVRDPEGAEAFQEFTLTLGQPK